MRSEEEVRTELETMNKAFDNLQVLFLNHKIAFEEFNKLVLQLVAVIDMLKWVLNEDNKKENEEEV